MPAAARAELQACVVAARPFLKGKTFDGSPLFRHCCIRAMQVRYPEIARDLTHVRFTGEGGFVATDLAGDLGDLDDALQRINQGGGSR